MISKRATLKVLAQYPSFYFSYWLFCLDGHAFVLATIFLESLAWLLVEQSPGVEKLLSASLDVPYKRC